MEQSKEVVLIRAGRLEDTVRVAEQVVEMAVVYDGMLQFCKTQAEDHRRMLEAGLLKLMVAEAEGRVVGILLYTMSHASQHAEPGLYLQSLYVDEAFRRHRVGQSLLIALARQAKSSGWSHLKLIAHQDNHVVGWYRRLGFQVITETEGVGFLELLGDDLTESMVAAWRDPLPPGVRLEMRDSKPGLAEVEAGFRFAMSNSDCNCSLRGSAALSYCMWQGPVLQMDLEAVRPSCASSSCTLMSRTAVSCLVGRLLHALAPIRPVNFWAEVARNRPGGLAELLEACDFGDNTENEGWIICTLDGPPLSELADKPMTCRVDPGLSQCWNRND